MDIVTRVFEREILKYLTNGKIVGIMLLVFNFLEGNDYE